MEHAPETPNIVFILGESHAPDLIGALGHRHIKTPHLDRLVQCGVSFANAYCASPLCVPARAAIATGRFPHESGYWDSSMAFDGAVDSWMKRLRGAGYETVGIGKMHFRSDQDDNGFSRFVETMHIADGIGDLVSALRYEGSEPTYEGLWRIWTSQYGAGDENPYRQYDERIASEAVNWLGSVDPTCEKPWALSVHFIAAHAPFVTPSAFQGLYSADTIPEPISFSRSERPYHPSIAHVRETVCHADDMPLEHAQEIRAAYYATVSYLDDLIGRVLDALDEKGLSENTLIVYTSDHGFSLGDHFVFGLFHMYEESLRVPLIVAGPKITSGRTIGAPVSHADLFPTLLEACGVPLNEEENARLGTSLSAMLSGEDRGEDRVVFAEYHGTGSRSAGYVVRQGRWKLIHFVGLPAQLYDLSTDPEEAQNLAEEPAHDAQLVHMMTLLRERVDPDAVDARAKADQRALVERHGGKDKVLQDMAGFSYTPPPGMRWQAMNEGGDGNQL